jgi:hypothetical protein
MATAANLKARYPEFAAVADALVTLVIAEAAAHVDVTWREVDRDPATIAMAAHLLALEGEPMRSNGQVVAAGAGLPQKVKVGDTQVDFADTSQARGASTDLNRTTYGATFLRLRNRNFPAVAVV